MALIDGLFKYLKDRGGSDLHLVVGHPPKLRVHGNIIDMPDQPRIDVEGMRNLLYEILSEPQQNTYTDEHDLDFAYTVPGVARFRCNYFLQHDGPAAVFRIIPERIMTLEELNLPPVLGTLADLSRGLVLVTGPTGSGKSTTQAAIIDRINTVHSRHIITIEDPVEFVHQAKKSLITHREVGRHATSFASALRAAVREDPDVILVGEMRDLITIELAISAAEMGFLVFGTLHTNSAVKTIDRIIDVFPPSQQDAVRAQLAGSLAAIVSQLLLRTPDGKGRAAAHEILLSAPGLSNVVREGNMSMLRSIIQTGRDRGMQMMDDSLLQLVKEGRADKQDAFHKLNDKKRGVE